MFTFEKQPVYYVAFFVISCPSIEEVRATAPDALAAHLQRSKQWQEQGKLFMAGAFLDNPDEPLMTMGILRSREAAEEFANGDPFVLNGMVAHWYIREWANILA